MVIPGIIAGGRRLRATDPSDGGGGGDQPSWVPGNPINITEDNEVFGDWYVYETSETDSVINPGYDTSPPSINWESAGTGVKTYTVRFRRDALEAVTFSAFYMQLKWDGVPGERIRRTFTVNAGGSTIGGGGNGIHAIPYTAEYSKIMTARLISAGQSLEVSLIISAVDFAAMGATSLTLEYAGYES